MGVSIEDDASLKSGDVLDELFTKTRRAHWSRTDGSEVPDVVQTTQTVEALWAGNLKVGGSSSSKACGSGSSKAGAANSSRAGGSAASNPVARASCTVPAASVGSEGS